MKKIKITQIKSSIDRPERQKLTLRALGLNKMNASREVEASAQILGMVRAVNHLIRIEETTGSGMSSEAQVQDVIEYIPNPELIGSAQVDPTGDIAESSTVVEAEETVRVLHPEADDNIEQTEQSVIATPNPVSALASQIDIEESKEEIKENSAHDQVIEDHPSEITKEDTTNN